MFCGTVLDFYSADNLCRMGGPKKPLMGINKASHTNLVSWIIYTHKQRLYVAHRDSWYDNESLIF
jgi:hypothetical protein